MLNGCHLLIDAKDVRNSFLLCSHIVLCKLLQDIVKATGLHPASEPQITVFPADETHMAGYTIFIPLMESHISIHTYAEDHGFAVDLFCCRPFDTDAAVKLVRQSFGNGQYNVQVIQRKL